MIDDELIARTFRRSKAEAWQVPPDVFAEALQRGVAKAFGARKPSSAELEAHLAAVHVEDLALACACARGHDAAWDHFVLTFRPVLYRAADAIDPSGRAREAADALYGELYGLKEHDGERASLFRYYHGRSSLATWLRAILSQRWVDVVRAHRRMDPLPDDGSPQVATESPHAVPDADRRRFAAAMKEALARAVSGLDPRDRLRLGCYYAQGMRLAQIGRLTSEHEATVSRQLARTRRTIREAVERRLRDAHGYGEREIDECFATVVDDAGSLDLVEVLGEAAERKKFSRDRSIKEDQP